MKQIVLTVMGAIGLCMPMIGCLIGLIRYRKTKEKISAQLELERKQAEEKGGLSSLYYKREDKRLFKRTFVGQAKSAQSRFTLYELSVLIKLL